MIEEYRINDAYVAKTTYLKQYAEHSMRHATMWSGSRKDVVTSDLRPGASIWCFSLLEYLYYYRYLPECKYWVKETFEGTRSNYK